jgi:ComEC/Rec2-related protein
MPATRPKKRPPLLKPLLDVRYQTAFGAGFVLWLLGAWLAQALFSETLWFWGVWLVGALALSVLFFLTHQPRPYLLLGTGLFIVILGGFISESYTCLHPNSALFKNLYHLNLVNSNNTPHDTLTDRPHRYTATAQMPWRASNSTPTQGSPRWIVALESVDEEAFSGLILLSLPKASPTDPNASIKAGQRIRFGATLQIPDGPLFPGDFSYRDYLRLHHIDATGYALFWDSLAPSEPSGNLLSTPKTLYYGILNAAIDARTQIIKTFKTYLPQPHAELLGSIVLGEHAIGMDDATKAHFRGLGLAHLLAASGLNVGIVAGFILCLGSLLKLPMRMTLVVTMVVVFIYAVMTGMPPSICRAATMFELGLFLKFTERQLSTPLILCMTAWLLALWDPTILLQLGFQLSFLSTLGIVLLTPRLTALLGYWLSPMLANTIVVPLVAQLWVLPLQLSVFQELSLMSLPANIVVLPIIALLTCVGFVSGGLVLLLSLVPGSEPLLGWSLLPADLLTQALLWLCNLLPEWTLSIGLANGAWGALLLVGITWVSYHLYRHTPLKEPLLARQGLLLLLLLVIPVSASHWAEHHEDRLIALSRDDETANILIQSKDGHSALIVAAFDWKSINSLKTYLRQHHITHVDNLVLNEPSANSSADLSTKLRPKSERPVLGFLQALNAENTLLLTPSPLQSLQAVSSSYWKTRQLLPRNQAHWIQVQTPTSRPLAVLVSGDSNEHGVPLFRLGQSTYQGHVQPGRGKTSYRARLLPISEAPPEKPVL